VILPYLQVRKAYRAIDLTHVGGGEVAFPIECRERVAQTTQALDAIPRNDLAPSNHADG
jgi:hypothetical protein